uniref:Putative transmembrane protein n=1 Tax=Toxoplasma gondii COUG TaxID=1074873 RepID=A0A2G8YE88_TOXGO|nr:putative transmembrane protein [Toxoplasma gondii COUG]
MERRRGEKKKTPVFLLRLPQWTLPRLAFFLLLPGSTLCSTSPSSLLVSFVSSPFLLSLFRCFFQWVFAFISSSVLTWFRRIYIGSLPSGPSSGGGLFLSFLSSFSPFSSSTAARKFSSSSISSVHWSSSRSPASASASSFFIPGFVLLRSSSSLFSLDSVALYHGFLAYFLFS